LKDDQSELLGQQDEVGVCGLVSRNFSFRVIAFAYTFAFSLARHNLKEPAKDKQKENIDHDAVIWSAVRISEK
jgi:hypothetical protein